MSTDQVIRGLLGETAIDPSSELLGYLSAVRQGQTQQPTRFCVSLVSTGSALATVCAAPLRDTESMLESCACRRE